MSPDSARDEMLAVFKAVWDATAFPVEWNDIQGNIPTSETPWARVTVRHADGGQSSLSNSIGAKIHTSVGTLIIQIFAPIGDGNSKAYELAFLVRKAYQRTGGAVWYRHQRIKEVGNSGAFEQVNVLIDFSYDDTL